MPALIQKVWEKVRSFDVKNPINSSREIVSAGCDAINAGCDVTEFVPEIAVPISSPIMSVVKGVNNTFTIIGASLGAYKAVTEIAESRYKITQLMIVREKDCANLKLNVEIAKIKVIKEDQKSFQIHSLL